MATVARTGADIILPAAAYTEEQGLFVNTEGRPQLALRAGFARRARPRKTGPSCGRFSGRAWMPPLPYDSLAQLRQASGGKGAPHLEESWAPCLKMSGISGAEGGTLGAAAHIAATP